MARISRGIELWLVALLGTCLGAWLTLAAGGSGFAPVVVCSAGSGWTPSSASLDVALVLDSPSKLVGDWALMIAAMMSPLVISPLRHVRNRSFARRRTRATLLFVTGYVAVWIGAALGLQGLALAARTAAPTPLWLGVAALAALAWQLAPAKQWCLNRCHRRPKLSAFGTRADRDAFVFGLTNGGACAGACWALMLLPFFAGPAHFLAMVAVMLFVCGERLEGPGRLAWRWRGPGKALRMVAAQTAMRLEPPRNMALLP
jgi:predicted metal-binding membrane protein